MALLFENLVKTNRVAFFARVLQVADTLGLNPNWLMLVMFMESRLNHQAVNPKGGATGLIQFMPKTALALGTTTTELLRMSNVAQLDYVQKYFWPYRSYINGFTDLYLITFYPAALMLKKPDSWNFPKLVYEFNRGLDRNGDGTVNLGEFKKFILGKVPGTFPVAELKKKLPVLPAGPVPPSLV